MKHILAFFLATILVLGCGGGGGVPPIERNAFVVGDLPLQTPVHGRNAPIIDFDGSLHVGAKVAPEINQLGVTGARGEVSISSGSVRDGAGRAAVVEFMKQFIHSGLPTYPSPPIVRVARGTSPKDMNNTVRAVQILNAYLPYDDRLSFSNIPSPPGVATYEVPSGEIFIDFAPHSEWNPPTTRPADREPRGVTRSPTRVDEISGTENVIYLEPRSSRIWINTNRIPEHSDESMILLIAHELLHALGFRGHPDHTVYPASVTRSRVPRVFSERILGPVDADAILALYTAYKRGETSAESLGPWSDTSFHIRGDLSFTGGDVSFGVALRNGLAQPWASGPTPSTNLVDNEELSGVVTWTGALLGITPSAETVVGDSRLAVDLADHDGRLDFTNLQFDGGGTWDHRGETSAEALGPWSDTSFHIRGDLSVAGGDVSFGVALRNGLAQPWASGPTPSTNLVDNEELSGVVTWTGALLGITPSAETVVGDSRLAVDLADHDGRLDFTNLQFDGGGTWGDGDLGYTVEVRGNTFVQTGGDAGQVTGAFFGSGHDGMGGVLERDDLSAAFGGKR